MHTYIHTHIHAHKHRWLEPREEHRKYQHGWIGFGGGRHRCIGENFAYVQIKTIWAYLIRNFDMDLIGQLRVLVTLRVNLYSKMDEYLRMRVCIMNTLIGQLST